MKESGPIVVRAKVLGYCFGVRRAVDMAVKAAAQYPRQPIYTYGPLIHNPQALDFLKDRGITVLDDESPQAEPVRVQGAVVIIRAHGVPPEIRQRLEEQGARIVDATCPRVVKSQKLAAQFSASGYTVIIAGDTDHGEVAGIAGFAPGCVIVENPGEAELLAKSARCPQKAALIAQTTISQGEYDAIALALLPAIPDLRVCATICPAATERQQALEELCGQVDGVLVIGGRSSANTRRLLSTAQKRCALSALIESPDEIPERFFSLPRTGITAGASTPDEIIEQTAARLSAGE
ncbi:MAG: 4-hydroxy-3-methylbut-2-enyl diphosphate reductase [Treponema sp.]|nr:4-hydroxy-3-methylbut-2-enyl diphosphate reductase [Treponema sp.]